MKNGMIVEDVSDTRQWLAGLLDQAFPGIEITPCSCIVDAQTAHAEP